MNVIVTKSYEESCIYAAEMILQEVKENPDSKLGLATGGTAEQVYPHLVKAFQDGRVSFSRISTINLDEYIGMPEDSPQSYRRCMDEWFFDKVDIDKSKTYVPSGINPIQEEITQFNKKLYEDKFIDLQLLGVGVSGHIGFNEPGDFLTAGVHIETLAEATVRSNARFFKSEDEVPRESITMGIGDILKAQRIVLIATGASKAEVIRRLLLDDAVTTQYPVTVLKLHRDVTIVIDKKLSDEVGYKG